MASSSKKSFREFIDQHDDHNDSQDVAEHKPLRKFRNVSHENREIKRQEEEIAERMGTANRLIDSHVKLCNDVKNLIQTIEVTLKRIGSLEQEMKKGDMRDAKLARKLDLDRLTNDLRAAHRGIRSAHKKSYAAGMVRREAILADIRSGK